MKNNKLCKYVTTIAKPKTIIIERRISNEE